MKNDFECVGFNDYDDYNRALRIINNASSVNIKDQIAGAYNEGYMCGHKEAGKARPQGEWVDIKFDYALTYANCSQCGKKEEQISYCDGQVVIRKFKPFCPNCGAKMKGGAE